MKQYPYTLWVLILPEENLPDANGNYSDQGSEWRQISSCRDEANSGGQTVRLEDGSVLAFDSVVQLPKSCQNVPPGTSIEVRNGDTVRLKGMVKRFQADQMHSRLWV